MDSDRRRVERSKLRTLLVVAPTAVLLMVACTDEGRVELAGTFRGDGPVGTGVADIEIGSDLTSLCWTSGGWSEP